ncbi:FecR family protein [Flagellimonas sp.]|uniref:FecR family protein n=1 Tax=Flagellimonas sp. TaxID=2058762 RepID=UPI003B5CA7A3
MDNKLINKYLSGKASKEETRAIFDWIDASPKNKHEFMELKKIWSLSVEVDGDKEGAWKLVEKKLKDLKRRKRINTSLKYAAVLLIGTGVAIGLKNEKPVEQLPQDQIILELSDGTKKILRNDGSQEILDPNGAVLGKHDQNAISYENAKTGSDNGELAYNTLYIPYSKRFNLVLSDGTTVHLNSGTTLKYPVKFSKEGQREVFLDGEAFFEVSKNKESEFIVRANGLDTRVYGTRFNINAYQDDDIQEVVLVEGSIGVQKEGGGGKELLLDPNEKAAINDRGQLFRESVDISGYIAWIDGVLIFENERLGNILKKLERHYDVSIQNNYHAINDNRYTGHFDIESVDDILRTFSKHKPFVYAVDGRNIVISP